MKVPKILTNKYILYLVVFLSITNMIGYLIMGSMNALIYFLIIGLVTSMFTKNMNIILLSALILSNIFVVGQSYSEGFTDNKNTDTIKKNTMVNATPSNSMNSQQKSTNNTKKTHTSSTSGKLPMTPVNDGPMDSEMDNASGSSGSEMSKTDEAFEVGLENGTKNNYRVDYASTIEDAYGQLNEILGSEGIKRLTDDTQNLLKQQVQLADAMKSMGPLISNMAPLIEQTKGLMNGIGGFDIKNLGNFASLAKGFTPASSNSPIENA
jgi:hypothetical protein